MSTGYTTERREEFYASSGYELLKQLMPELINIPCDRYVEIVGPAVANHTIGKQSKIIDVLWKMVVDARNDLDYEREKNCVKN